MQVDSFIIRKIAKTLIEYSVVILLGLCIVYLDESEFSGIDIKNIILVCAGFKSVYFFRKGFRKIAELTLRDVEYYEFLLFIAFNIGVIIVSFGVDYFCLYRADPKSFSGLEEGMGAGALAFKFFYFSLMIFTNIGIVKVIPESTEAEILLILEAAISFITIIFVLSDFLSLKESLSRISSGNSVGEGEKNGRR
ncbi:ion transporter [Leptospira wolffii]|uniref:hypothetical protein n=1 Tax=Leptospira wolffii TaxID=409998 RepID=UPI00031F658B|nr:hypothetical protein [Leptospira wolffii]EPG66804.1 hypothetical protein LEP1GSC061_1616 [Leptospira wolffii serovar Khorat str. Khorat-H2]TGK55905.1 ion transporter [Leptospira wolffii]TGK75774.1 ion transporter [Leptospira wolffii]TGK75896.1 ion transporter [Leptospira wolffii]TGL27528.1 ion transporter [Leptospira wolffii]